MKTADTIIAWIEENMVIPQGDGAGEKCSLMPFQERLIRGIYRRGVTTAAYSTPRANSKSTTAAFLACAYLWGPLAKPRTTVVIVASSIQQGSEVFDQVLPQLPKDRDFKVWDSFNAREIEDRETGITLRVLGSNPRMMLGLKPAALLLDEPQSWGPQSEKAFASLKSATGKIKGAKLIACGTMTDDENHWFSRLISGEADFAMLYQSKAKKTWWSNQAMRTANPAYDYLPTLRADLHKQRDAARGSEAAASIYRSLNLNQGGDGTQDSFDVLITAKDYARLESETVNIGDYVLSLDPADGFSQFGVCAVSLDAGIDGAHDVDGFAAWPEADNVLPERSKKDGIDYGKWIRAGDLVLTHGPVVDIPEVIETAFSRFGKPRFIVCDLYRFRELKYHLSRHGYSEEDGNLITRRAGGWGDGSADCRAFFRYVRAGDLRFKKSDAMRDSFSQARTIQDSSGNVRVAKFHERSTRGRDDISAACVFGVGVLARQEQEPVEQSSVYMYHVV